MLRELSCEGLGEVKSLEELVSLAASIGFEAVDAPPYLVRDAAAREGVTALRDKISDRGVALGSFPSSARWIDTEEEFQESLPVFYEDVKLYAALGCGICHTFIMPSCQEAPLEWYHTGAKRLRVLADILDIYGMKLALEYVGPYSMRKSRTYPFIWNSRQTVEWISMIARPNVGLLLDSFHWYVAGETPEDLKKVPPQLIFHVHVNDAPDLDRQKIQDNDRLYCGEGVIPLNEFMGVLREKHYTGMVAQEVLSAEKPKQPNQVLAGKTQQVYRDILGL